jgi:hypothetical protein
MTHISRPLTILAAMLAAVALLAVTMGSKPASAIVPPKDCGFVKVKGKRYNIKSDQLKCKKAREYSVTYLKTHHKPRYYKCFTYSTGAQKFRCQATHYNPDRTFFAIKR